jgi:hypothetical protein
VVADLDHLLLGWHVVESVGMLHGRAQCEIA